MLRLGSKQLVLQRLINELNSQVKELLFHKDLIISYFSHFQNFNLCFMEK